MSLTIYVDRIPESGLEINEQMTREWLDNIPEFSVDEGTHIEGLLLIRGRVSVEGGNVRVRGRIQAKIETLCTRCGDAAELLLDSELDIMLMPGDHAEMELDHELTPDELDEMYYQGNKIELDDYFREQLALDIPMTMLCNDGCRGLCTLCGANLNREQCSCEHDAGDPRLAVLRGLKIDKD